MLIGEIIALTPTQNDPLTMEEHADEVIDLKEEQIEEYTQMFSLDREEELEL